MKKILNIIIIFITILLMGCSSAGNSTSDNTTEVKRLGVFLDTYVSGIRYVSTSPTGKVIEGITNASGEFEFFKDGTTKFYIGELELGTSKSDSVVLASNLGENNTHSENILRLIQTLDDDNDPSNGIAIPEQISENTKKISASIDVKSVDFTSQYSQVSTKLFQDTGLSSRDLVETTIALEHSSFSDRLASISQLKLGEVIFNQKTYSNHYYNTDKFTSSQKRRLYLWIWENKLENYFNIEQEMSKFSLDIDNIEKTHDLIESSLELTESAISILSLHKDMQKMLKTYTKKRSSTYMMLAKSTGLGLNSCDTVAQFYDASNNLLDTEVPLNSELCKLYLDTIDSGNDYINSKLTGITSALIEEGMYTYRWNLNLSNISKRLSVTLPKPNYTIDVAKITNDILGAYRANSSTKIQISKSIAKDWLSAHFRAAGDDKFRSRLITGDSTNEKILGLEAQVDYIAQKSANSSLWCDLYQFFNPFSTCDKNSISYDKTLVLELISDYLSKSNKEYKRLETLIGVVPDSNTEVGLFNIENFRDILPPTITSSDTISVNENQTSALTVVATDKSTVTYSISGIDSGSFNIDSSTGVISFKSAPNYEVKRSYSITVIATDESSNSSTQDIIINILNVGETVPNTTTKVLKTGQTKSYTDYDDGYYQKGADRSYTRGADIVVDNTTGLQWQDNSDVATVKKPWITQANYDDGNYSDTSGDTAVKYCESLSLGGYSDWRLPRIEELETIVDLGRHTPSIDPVFQNTTSNNYWSSTTYSNSNYFAWIVYFYYGSSNGNTKYISNYVRCVRAGQ